MNITDEQLQGLVTYCQDILPTKYGMTILKWIEELKKVNKPKDAVEEAEVIQEKP